MRLPSICVVSELPPPSGGMAVQARNLVERLRQEGHEVRAVRTNQLDHASGWRRVRGVRGIVNLALFLARLWEPCGKSDCIHILSNSYLGFFLFTFPAVAAGKLLRKRVIIHYHGGAAKAFLNDWFWLARHALERADRVVVPSGFLSAVFGKHDIDTQVVPNVVDVEAFAFRDRSPLRPRVIIARHLEWDYNVACGIRAFAKLRETFPDATLTLAGDGSGRSALEALVSELGIAACVTFHGNVANERMRSLYDESDIFLNSSRVDNQPVSILEAFACGLPVVSTAVGGIPYVVSDRRDGLLVPDGDSEGLAAGMAELLRDAALARRVVEAARARLREFSWERVYADLRGIYAPAAEP